MMFKNICGFPSSYDKMWLTRRGSEIQGNSLIFYASSYMTGSGLTIDGGRTCW